MRFDLNIRRTYHEFDGKGKLLPKCMWRSVCIEGLSRAGNILMTKNRMNIWGNSDWEYSEQQMKCLCLSSETFELDRLVYIDVPGQEGRRSLHERL